MEAIKRTTASELIYQQLALSIIRGEFAAGEHLPTESALCERLQVSRPILREALARLQQSRLITSRQGAATKVEDWRVNASFDLLPLTLQATSGKDFAQISQSVFRMRLLLGVDAAQLCAQNASAANVKHLRALIEAMREAVGPKRRPMAMAYWSVVLRVAKCDAYHMAHNSIADIDYLYKPKKRSGPRHPDPDRYAELTEAIAAGDPVAAAECATTIIERGNTNWR